MQGGNASAQAAARTGPVSHIDPDGPSGPYPIPWLDMNGSHNQPAGPHLEPSHIYHFRGRVARCSGFSGMGTDGAHGAADVGQGHGGNLEGSTRLRCRASGAPAPS